MQSKFTFKHLDYSDSLVQYTDQKLDEIGRFLLKDGRCQVIYYKDQHEFVAEITINSKQKHFKATAHSSDVYVAVDLMVDRLEKQFLKTKEIYQHHKKFELSKAGRLKDINSQLEYQPKQPSKKVA
jgi:putative sigma-54 modulation protein